MDLLCVALGKTLEGFQKYSNTVSGWTQISTNIFLIKAFQNMFIMRMSGKCDQYSWGTMFGLYECEYDSWSFIYWVFIAVKPEKKVY